MDRLISLAALTVLDAGPLGQVEAAAAAGFTCVGLRLMPLLETDARIVGNAEQQTALELLLDDTGLEVLEIGVFPVKPEMDWPTIVQVLAFAGVIGARHIVCPIEDADTKRRVSTFQRLADLAAVEGLTALVEFNPYSACPTLTEADALLDKTFRPNAGHVIDVFHLSRSGGHPRNLTRVDPKRIRLIHLCDAPPPPSANRSIDELRAESRTARLLPGEGSLWLDELLRAVPADVPLSIEAPSAMHAHLSPTDRARRALDATRRLLDRDGG